jgi:WD40 repeat protein
MASVSLPTATMWFHLYVLCIVLLSFAAAFVPQRAAPRTLLLHHSSFGDDNELAQALRARQEELQNQDDGRYENWKTAKCETSIPIALPDWVRRIDIQYPLVAAGSSSGTIFLSHAETGDIIAQSERLEVEELDDIESVIRILYGPYDGGGTTAIAMSGDLIVSAGRQGSVQIHRYDKSSKILLSQGSIKALEGVLVTCLELHEDHAWIGTADGRVLALSHSDAMKPLSLQNKPAVEFTAGSSAILSLSLEPSIGYGVFTTAKGSVELFSMENDNRILASWYPPFDSGVSRQSRNTYPLTATIVASKDESKLYMACGASDGSLYLHPLTWTDGDLDILHPLQGEAIECAPRHQGALKCLTSPKPGLLISGGQDGAIRMWDVSEGICQYQFMGTSILCFFADGTIVAHSTVTLFFV